VQWTFLSLVKAGVTRGNESCAVLELIELRWAGRSRRLSPISDARWKNESTAERDHAHPYVAGWRWKKWDSKTREAACAAGTGR